MSAGGIQPYLLARTHSFHPISCVGLCSPWRTCPKRQETAGTGEQGQAGQLQPLLRMDRASQVPARGASGCDRGHGQGLAGMDGLSPIPWALPLVQASVLPSELGSKKHPFSFLFHT